MQKIQLFQGATEPKLKVTLYEEEGVPINFVTYPVDSIQLIILKDPIVTRTMTVTSASGGEVEYSWLAADTADVGYFSFYIQVNFSSGSIAKITSEPGEFDKLRVYKLTDDC